MGSAGASTLWPRWQSMHAAAGSPFVTWAWGLRATARPSLP